jgi:hypothetical protein
MLIVEYFSNNFFSSFLSIYLSTFKTLSQRLAK